MPAPEVHLACTRPGHWSSAQWHELEPLLDANERETARRFRFDADRLAYAAAHAMLRALVVQVAGLPADEVELRHDTKGRPFIACAPQWHVSLSRSRDAVACAVTSTASVGVDIEQLDSKPVDADLLGEFVVTHDPVTARQFYFQWTALEAFWKACGTGLADGNPRIHCTPRNASRFDVRLEHGESIAGRGAIVHAFDDCALAVVLRAPADPDFVLKRTNCRTASDIAQLGMAPAAHHRFLERHFDQ